MNTVESHEFSLQLPNGLRLAGKRWGPLENPKERVIALHGWLDNASTWDGVAPILARQGMCVLCLDFLGHGKSDHIPAVDEYSLFCHVATVNYAIQVIGWKQFVLMGHSMGAAVSTIVAATFPEYIKCTILVEGLGT
eukprot:TRINITY_DN6560_c0_g1_i1.p1 TRINITY_DN6560_c0_g1~~TRINITY_DN6560_c0_g1_i1.p1  ORF type:complete len:137 (+),score=10.24 TRINITY_DN6560_c0_g1_i1:36-446(+)